MLTHIPVTLPLCSEDDTVGDLKKLVAAHIGTRPEKIRIQKWYIIYKVRCALSGHRSAGYYLRACATLRRFALTTLFLPSAIHPRAYRRSTLHSRAQDHITLEDYEIHDGDGLELYYN
mgnify:CR=1 FL=1